MIKINKGSEPREWVEKRNTPGFKYEAIPELRESLLEEQGYICAYCMCRIGESNSKIEHIKSKSPEKFPELSLSYSNMIICCMGGEGSKGEKHCDTSKEDKDISFDLFTDVFFETISYGSKSGEIKSSNATYSQEINLSSTYLQFNPIPLWNHY